MIKVPVKYRPNPFRMTYPLVGFLILKKDGTIRAEGNVRVKKVFAEVLESGVKDCWFVNTYFPKKIKIKAGDSFQITPRIEGGKEYFI